MQTQFNREWWKMKAYNALAAYLKHPNDNRKQQLHTALAQYEQMFNRSQGNTGTTAAFPDMELSMNEY
ncbi:MAG: hypothetical protein PVJ39_05675 [Gammaproteobacteria bacterium]|jgi:hypothetical protein